MPRLLAVLVLVLLSPLSLLCQEYALGPDSRRNPGVPEGKIEKHEWKSEIFPGTVRDYWIYVPAQYDGSAPAAVMVFQDGDSMRSTGRETPWLTPIVLDNLIHKGEMPVTIGVFVNWGRLPAFEKGQGDRINRSFEYDALGDRYARFLIEEILPEVGKRYKLTDDPNLRGIGGASSGGIAAFTAAWERPDAFRRVLSFIGSFVDLRGGQIYASLVRKTEPKPLRVYLQDGSGDLDIYAGSWWMGNQDLVAALKFAGYDYEFVTGTGGHDNVQARAVLPDALRWLWKDWEQPIEAPSSEGDRQWITRILDPEHGWESVSEGHEFTEGPAVAPNGDVYFTDVPAGKIWKISGGDEPSVFKENADYPSGLEFGAHGRLYACQAKGIVAYDLEGEEEVIAEGAKCDDLVISARGDIYYTDLGNSSVYLIWKGGAPTLVQQHTRKDWQPPRGIHRPNGIAVSPDQSLLAVADSGSGWVWSFQIQPDGTLDHGQRFYRVEGPGAGGITFSAEGRLYAAVLGDGGLQIFDQLGRVVGIINQPQRGWLTNVVFAGPEMKTLYVTAGDKVFRRKIRKKGALPWRTATPPKPNL